TLNYAAALSGGLASGAGLGAIGGGWLGLEVAAGARGRGAEVTVVEAAGQPLTAAVGPELGAVFAGLHREHGVDLRTETTVEAITTENGRATGLRLAGGRQIEADLVLVAVGARANIAPAAGAGIPTDRRRLLTDAELRTSARPSNA